MILDLFAGPGGWDVAALALGVEPLGVEWDDAACATREAAGLRTVQGDVGKLEPGDFIHDENGEKIPLDGLIASPPCQAFSMAGKGVGRKVMREYEACMTRMSKGWDINVEHLDGVCGDPRAHLVLEPLRWALALKPTWIACEQVEPVLPLWEAMASALRQVGYKTWVGVLSSEQYGVPQTRKRAILLASLDVQPERPAPTHQRYVSPRRREAQEDSLFAAPEPERIVQPEDRDLLPWVSMAEALGWGMTARPTNTLTAGNGPGSQSRPLDSGARSRALLAREQDEGRWEDGDLVGFPRLADTDDRVELDGVDYRDRDLRPASEPAFALTEKARSWVRFRATNERPHGAERGLDDPAPALAFGHNPPRWIVDTGNTRSGSRDEGRKRPTDEPSPPLTTRGDQMEWRDDEPRTEAHTVLDTQRDFRDGETKQKRPASEPSPTLSGGGKQLTQWKWVDDRPATTIAGDARVFPPGGHLANDGRDNSRMVPRSGGEDSRTQAVRVTVQEALVLQSFPADYPVQGNKTAQFRQIGDAIPPLLAYAALCAVVPEPTYAQ